MIYQILVTIGRFFVHISSIIDRLFNFSTCSDKNSIEKTLNFNRRCSPYFHDSRKIPTVGDIVYNYHIQDKIRNTPFGIEYSGVDTEHNTNVRIKVIPFFKGSKPHQKEINRRTREGILLLKCNHPNVAEILDTVSYTHLTLPTILLV